MSETDLVPIMRRLRDWAIISRSDRGVLPLAADEADAILAALERAERVEEAADKLSIAIAIYQQSGRWNPIADAVEAVRAALATAPEGSDG